MSFTRERLESTSPTSPVAGLGFDYEIQAAARQSFGLSTLLVFCFDGRGAASHVASNMASLHSWRFYLNFSVPSIPSSRFNCDSIGCEAVTS
ncbi:MAG: hypothetical protein CL912_31060 [Deltaproteobacteria bacterium]|nr:hypothetical protein [Deltaproteobacteria bacterium]